MHGVTNPWLVAVIAIFPGLGFLLLRQYRNAFIVFFAVIVLIAIWIFVPIELVRDLSLAFAVLVWINQIIYSFRYAKFLRSQASRLSSVPRMLEENLLPPPSELDRDEKVEYKASQIVKSQLDIGEHCLVALKVVFARYSTHYLGLTSTYLIVIATDFIGAPIDVRRINRNDIEDFRVDQAMIGPQKPQIFLHSKETLEYTVYGQQNTLNRFLDNSASHRIS